MARWLGVALLVLGLVSGRPVAAQTAHDDFHHLGQINKASIVMLEGVGLVPSPMATTIAEGIRTVITEQTASSAARSADYLVFEARLVEVSGRDASRLHTGRSRQDIGSTYRRLATREALLGGYEALLAPRDALLELAGHDQLAELIRDLLVGLAHRLHIHASRRPPSLRRIAVGARGLRARHAARGRRGAHDISNTAFEAADVGADAAGSSRPS